MGEYITIKIEELTTLEVGFLIDNPTTAVTDEGTWFFLTQMMVMSIYNNHISIYSHNGSDSKLVINRNNTIVFHTFDIKILQLKMTRENET